jgi:hypothetical protein
MFSPGNSAELTIAAQSWLCQREERYLSGMEKAPLIVTQARFR